MRYLIITLMTLALVSCNQNSTTCYEPCKDTCVKEEPPETEPAPVVIEKPGMHNSMFELTKQFEQMAFEKLKIKPQMTVASNPVTGISTIITTSLQMDLISARELITETAQLLVELANENEFIKSNAPKFPLTVADLDIIIDSTVSDSNVKSVTLLRGMIEYESLDKESNTYKITKQEPIERAQAKLNGNCCGSFFVAKKAILQ